MEQYQFKVSLPLGTKLLLSIVLLVLILIGFLSASTILLLKEDKTAYTFQAQATEAQLAAQEFEGMIEKTVDVLKLYLGAVDPYRPISLQQKNNLKAIVSNQSQAQAIQLQLVQIRKSSSQLIAESLHPKIDPAFQQAGALQVSKDWLKIMIPQLTQKGVAFANVSKVGAPPLLAIAVADFGFKSRPRGVPIAFAYVSQERLLSIPLGSHLTVSDRSGWVLFDSDATKIYELRNISDDLLFRAATQTKLASGAQEFETEDVHFLGSFTKPGSGIIAMTKSDWREVMRASYVLTEKFILLGIMAICAAIIFAILFAKTLTRPLASLYDATKEVAQGNFDLNLAVQSRDEIGALSGSFNVMSTKIQDLISESMEKVRMEGELAIASTVQQTLIPPERYEHQHIRIQSHYESASECGGDWWGFFGVGNKMTLLIADATGHGLPSALITAAARSCFSVMHKLAQEDPDFTFSPGAMLAFANRVIFEAAIGQINMTFFAGVVDFENRTLTYANAGHNPPWLFKKNGEKFKLKSLTGKGRRLGEIRDIDPFLEKTVELASNDILFLYTDGLLEGKDLKGNEYGKKRVKKTMEEWVPKGPEVALETLVTDFKKHNQGKAYDDDLTLAIAQLFPSAQSNINEPPPKKNEGAA